MLLPSIWMVRIFCYAHNNNNNNNKRTRGKAEREQSHMRESTYVSKRLVDSKR